MRRLAQILSLIAVSGCQSVGGSDDTEVCSDAEARVIECFGADAARRFECNEDSAKDLAESSCEALADLAGKSDASLCSLFGVFCPAEPIFASPQGSPTQHPIVLVHGFNGSPENEWGVHPRIVEALGRDHQVHVARVSPFKPVATRAEELAFEIDSALERFDADRVNIIAHSMGGLDSRFTASRIEGFDQKIAAIVTISTPHRGSRIADAALGLLPEDGVVDDAIDALAEMFARSFTTDEMANGSDVAAAMSDLAEANATTFNAMTPDVPGIDYQSWAGISNVLGLPNAKDELACTAAGGPYLVHADRDWMDARLVAGAAFVAHGFELRPNDGMTTVESAAWGTFRGCIPADHYDEVGQPKPGFDDDTGLSPTDLYRFIAFDLAERGF